MSQDVAAQPAVLCGSSQPGGLIWTETWAKRLSGSGRMAVVVFNRGDWSGPGPCAPAPPYPAAPPPPRAPPALGPTPSPLSPAAPHSLACLGSAAEARASTGLAVARSCPSQLPRQRLSVCACGSQWCARGARVQLAARVWQRQRDGAVQRPRPLEPHRARGVFEADEPGRAGPRRAAGPRLSKRRGGMMFLQMVRTAQGSSASLLGPLLLLMAAQQPLAQLQACKHLKYS